MRWTGDAAAGDWLKRLIDDPPRFTMHDVVPRGFAAYARVFHPAFCGDDAVTWAETADAFGTTMHPRAQWNRIVRVAPEDGAQQVVAPDGREFFAPQEGGLDAGIVSILARVLAEHTTTPDAGGVALWEGWGGLLGGYGTNGRGFFSLGGDPVDRARDFLARSTRDVLNEVFLKGRWQDGILSREISEGTRLRLPMREHVLFEGGIREFAAADWELHVPWRDLPAEQHGFPPSALSPSIVWPDDHAWVLVTEVDYDSTIVAGSRALMAAVCATAGLEASAIPAETRLTWDSDEVNGP